MSIKLKGSTAGSVALDAPANTSPSGSDIALTLPIDAGSADQVLKNGSTPGQLEFGFPSGSVVQVVQQQATDVYQRAWSSNGQVNSMGTAFEVSLTPKDRSNYFLIEVCWMVSGDKQMNVGFAFKENSSGSYAFLRDSGGTNQLKNSSSTAYWNSANDWPNVQFAYGTGRWDPSSGNNEIMHSLNWRALTKLGTTSGSGAVTWRPDYYGGESSSLKINRQEDTTTSSYWSFPAVSFTTVTEIVA